MPTYDYRCRKCGHRYELFHSITDDKPRRCPRCRGRADRVPAGGAGLLFKGSGFYITDYRSSAYREKARSEKGEGKSGESKTGESKAREGKPGGDKKTAGASEKKSGSGSGKRAAND